METSLEYRVQGFHKENRVFRCLTQWEVLRLPKKLTVNYCLWFTLSNKAYTCLYMTRVIFHVPQHPDVDLAFMHAVEEALHERGPLQREGRNQEVEAHAAEAVALQEGHEEAETDEDHHVHVLET